VHYEDEGRVLKGELVGSVSTILERRMEIQRTAMSDAILLRVLPVPEDRRAISTPISHKAEYACLKMYTWTSQGVMTRSEENVEQR